MSTRTAAVAAAIFFVFGALIQIWSSQLGLTLMLLGLMAAVASVLNFQRAIQRRLIKQDRFLNHIKASVAEVKAETMKYGSSIFRRIRLLTDDSVARRPAAQNPRELAAAATTNSTGQARVSTASSRSKPLANVNDSEPLTKTTGSSGRPNLEGLKRIFDVDPSASNLEILITHMWNKRGEIIRPAGLIHRHRDLICDFSVSGALLARQISDAADLCTELPQVPLRSTGSITTSLPDRVLYCVHATPTFHSNGYAIRTSGVAQGLVANGKQVRVVGRPGYPWDVKGINHPPRERCVQVSDGVDYVHLPTIGVNKLPKGAYVQAAADAIVREALEFRPSVIQAASNSQNALAALLAARRLGLPFIYEVRGLWEITQAAVSEGWNASERYQLDVALETLVAREADAIAVITRQLGDELVRRGADRDRISVVPNSVDTDELQPLLKDATYEPVLGLPDVPLIGFAGSIVAYEGLDLLVDAISRLNAEGTPCHLLIAGSGSYESALKEHVRASNLGEVVHFLGRIPHDDVRRLLASLDVVVCPRSSNQVTEMVSAIKPLEAFAAGRVVLMSNVAPQRDLSSDGKIAPLFAADDLDALTEALRRLLLDRDLRRDYERRARLWVDDHRTWRATCANFLSAYKTANAAHQKALGKDSNHREVAQITVAMAGSACPYLELSAACSVVNLVPDPATWCATFSANAIDLVILTAENEHNWNPEIIARLFQFASESAVPNLVVSKGPVGPEHPHAGVIRLADHLGIVGINSLDAETPPLEGCKTTVSTVLETFDPLTTSPLTATHRETSIAVLGDSIPSTQILDVARAHNLRIHSVEDLRLPARFTGSYEKHANFDDSLRRASAATALLRGADNGDPVSAAKVLAGGGVIVTTDECTDLDWFDEYLTRLASNSQEWARRSWSSVRRAHRTAGLRLALTDLFRAAGLQIGYRAHPKYAVSLRSDQYDLIPLLLSQTVLPSSIVVQEGFDIDAPSVENARSYGVAFTFTNPADVEFLGQAVDGIAPTFYEDLLIASSFADVQEIRVAPIGEGAPKLIEEKNDVSTFGRIALQKTEVPTTSVAGHALIARLPEVDIATSPNASEAQTSSHTPDYMTPTKPRAPEVLIAGHDLKFVNDISAALLDHGINVYRDKWSFHNSHDEQRSRDLVGQADVIFCEWGLGNAVWYSKHKRSEQRLVVRVHLQEISTPYLKLIDHSAVDAYVFVSEIVRAAAVTFHGIPSKKTIVIPNALDPGKLQLPKQREAEKTIGFVGVVPQRKRLDLALDVLERVRTVDPEYRLIVKGKDPHDFPWMANRPKELAWYREVYDRIDAINGANPGTVMLEGHGDDMPGWYSRIGVVLSTSDFESFHYTIADGVASGARPAVLYWPGAESIYPRQWLFDSVESVAYSILEGTYQPADAEYVVQHFGIEKITNDLEALLINGAREWNAPGSSNEGAQQ